MDLHRTLRETAIRAARAGGTVAKGWSRQVFDVALKADRSEVSEADYAAEAAVIEAIRGDRPADLILSEESIRQHTETFGGANRGAARPAEVWWIIDPIDGTRNFVRGLPGFGCAVAAMIGGTPVAAATFDVTGDRMYSASRAEGFFVDDAALRPPDAARRRATTAKLLLAIPSGIDGVGRRLIDAWYAPHLLRNYGAAALHLAYVAAGGLDGMLAADCRLWDLAGGWLFVDLMGGACRRLDGSALFPLDIRAYAGEPLPALFAHDARTFERISAPLSA